MLRFLLLEELLKGVDEDGYVDNADVWGGLVGCWVYGVGFEFVKRWCGGGWVVDYVAEDGVLEVEVGEGAVGDEAGMPVST